MQLFSFLVAARLTVATLAARTTPSLEAPSSSDAILRIRHEMSRKLSADERSAYRGITMSGMTGTMYERLIAVDTAEELIISEWNGKQFIPSDDPENVYLVSIGRGITAQYNSDYVKKMVEFAGPGRVSEKTMSEMDAEYRNQVKSYTPGEEEAELEELLDEVAAGYLSWVEEQLGQSTLQTRQQGWYCKSQRQYCGQSGDCAKTRTIRPSQCICGSYDTCKTIPLQLPPYCHIGVHCAD